MSVGGEQERPVALRADARRNREQIIAAARTLFSEVGVDVPMEEVARAAGVGVGTLYRRFSDRDELIKAVGLDNVSLLADLAHQAERSEADPAAALIRLLRTTLELRLDITVMALSPRALQAIQESHAIAQQRDEVIAAARRLLRRAQQAGTIRPDIDVGDMMLALFLLSRLVMPAADELGEMAFQRLFTLVVDGLRATSGSPLPGRPFDQHDLEVLRQGGMRVIDKPTITGQG